MKTTLVPRALGLLAACLLLNGCVAAIGNSGKSPTGNATLGQQLIDLQKAKDCGAITPAEYEAQKQKLLDGK